MEVMISRRDLGPGDWLTKCCPVFVKANFLMGSISKSRPLSEGTKYIDKIRRYFEVGEQLAAYL